MQIKSKENTHRSNHTLTVYQLLNNPHVETHEATDPSVLDCLPLPGPVCVGQLRMRRRCLATPCSVAAGGEREGHMQENGPRSAASGEGEMREKVHAGLARRQRESARGGKRGTHWKKRARREIAGRTRSQEMKSEDTRIPCQGRCKRRYNVCWI